MRLPLLCWTAAANDDQTRLELTAKTIHPALLVLVLLCRPLRPEPAAPVPGAMAASEVAATHLLQLVSVNIDGLSTLPRKHLIKKLDIALLAGDAQRERRGGAAMAGRGGCRLPL